jgi:2-oxoglutarate dehydrogenase E1 component
MKPNKSIEAGYKKCYFFMKDFQYITGSHPSYIEGLYNDFVKDPNSVDADMRKFFEGFDFAVSNAAGNGNIASFVPIAKKGIWLLKQIR